jgi:hypothetical protein
LNAYDDDETEDEDMIGGTIYDSPKRDHIEEKLPQTDSSDAPASPSSIPPAKHEFDPRTATVSVASKNNRIMSDDEESTGDTDAVGEVETREAPTDDEEDDEDDNDATQPEYQDSADEGDYEDEDDEMELEEMDDDEDEDFDMGGKKSKRKGKATKKGNNGSERSGKKSREDSSSSKCESHGPVAAIWADMALHASVQVPARFESKISSRNESSDEDYGQDVARRTHRKPDHPSVTGIKRRRQGTVDTNDDSDAYRAMSSRTGKAIDYNEKAVDYGLESDEVEEEAPRPKANAYYNSGAHTLVVDRVSQLTESLQPTLMKSKGSLGTAGTTHGWTTRSTCRTRIW